MIIIQAKLQIWCKQRDMEDQCSHLLSGSGSMSEDFFIWILIQIQIQIQEAKRTEIMKEKNRKKIGKVTLNNFLTFN